MAGQQPISKKNGGFCWICDAAISTHRHPIDNEPICKRCHDKVMARIENSGVAIKYGYGSQS